MVVGTLLCYLYGTQRLRWRLSTLIAFINPDNGHRKFKTGQWGLCEKGRLR